jgi:hypothetical protein
MVSSSSHQSALQPSPDVVSRQLGDGAVLVHLTTNRVFQLNETGARVWELIAAGRTRAEIAEQLVVEFDVSGDEATRTLEPLLESLRADGLLRPW